MLRFSLLGIALGAMILASPAMARKPYGMAGCGLGSVLFEPSGSQVSAATTNSTAYNQFFGITSGTSNCLPRDQWAAVVKQEKFIVANFSTLSKEMAQGDGETLQAFSETLGCSANHYDAFAGHLKGDFSEIFKAPGALAVLDATRASLRGHPTLSQSCSHLYMIGGES